MSVRKSLSDGPCVAEGSAVPLPSWTRPYSCAPEMRIGLGQNSEIQAWLFDLYYAILAQNGTEIQSGPQEAEPGRSCKDADGLRAPMCP